MTMTVDPGLNGRDPDRRGGGCLVVLHDRKKSVVSIGLYNVVISLVSLLFLAYRFVTLKAVYQYQGWQRVTQLTASLAWMSSYVLFIVTSLVLVVGAIKENKYCMLPWLFNSIVSFAIEFWGIISVSQTHSTLHLELSGWEIFLLVFAVVRIVVQITSFGLVLIHARRMFEQERKGGRIPNMFHYIPQSTSYAADQAELQVTLATPSYFTVSSSFQNVCSQFPPPYSDSPPTYDDVVSMTPDRSAVI